MNWIIEIFVGDSIVPAEPLFNTYPPDYRANISLNDSRLVRPQKWLNSNGQTLHVNCKYVPQNKICITPNICYPTATSIPCIIDLERIRKMPISEWGPYFVNVWAFKEVNGNWIPVETSDNLRIKPYLEVFDVSGVTVLQKRFLSSETQPFSRGLNAFSIPNGDFQAIVDIYNNYFPIRSTNTMLIEFGVRIQGNEIDIPNGWARPYTWPYTRNVAQFLQGYNNVDTYRRLLCSSGSITFCECASISKILPNCSNLCRCIDPHGYNIRFYDNDYCSGIGVSETDCL